MTADDLSHMEQEVQRVGFLPAKDFYTLKAQVEELRREDIRYKNSVDYCHVEALEKALGGALLLLAEDDIKTCNTGQCGNCWFCKRALFLAKADALLRNAGE